MQPHDHIRILRLVENILVLDSYAGCQRLLMDFLKIRIFEKS